MSGRPLRSDPWDRDDDEAEASGRVPFKALTRQEAQALREREPSISPWRVVVVQAVVGALTATLVWLIWGELSVGLSALYGAAVAVVPGALMARGMTSRFSNMNAGTSAVSFMLWR